jgi:lipopolysaccharide/colanic/teichoic acid biosynthesis glycosyltransferase
MSLVGPRPHQPREVEQYLEHQRQVLTVRPGITGKAQVCGRDANTFDHEATLDIMYIENYTIWQDIVILFQTALLVVSRPYTQYMKNKK